MNSTEYRYLYKIVLIGDSGVGKTNIISRFSRNQFDLNSKATIGVEFTARIINMNNGIKVKVQIWDTAGQEKYYSLTSSYYRGSSGIILVYDVSCKKSFDNISNWLKQTKKYSESNTTILLLANKTDLTNTRTVTYFDGKNLATKNNCLFAETSARDDPNLTSIIENFVKQIYANKQESTFTDIKISDESDSQKINIIDKPQTKCICN